MKEVSANKKHFFFSGKMLTPGPFPLQNGPFFRKGRIRNPKRTNCVPYPPKATQTETPEKAQLDQFDTRKDPIRPIRPENTPIESTQSDRVKNKIKTNIITRPKLATPHCIDCSEHRLCRNIRRT